MLSEHMFLRYLNQSGKGASIAGVKVSRSSCRIFEKQKESNFPSLIFVFFSLIPKYIRLVRLNKFHFNNSFKN